MGINKWYSIGTLKEGVSCPNCEMNNKIIGTIHTNNRICPNCRIICIYFTLDKESIIQIIPERSPEVIKKFIDWFQNELNEMEFIFLKGYIKTILLDLTKRNYTIKKE